MRNLLVVTLTIILASCASNFNKNKKIDRDFVLGEMVLKQDDKMINRVQVYDQIGRKSDRKELTQLKKEYTLAMGAAGVGGGILGWGIVQENNSNMILIGGALAGAAIYYAIQGDKKLAPYIENHNRSVSRSSFFPHFFIAPSDRSVVTGLGYNFGF